MRNEFSTNFNWILLTLILKSGWSTSSILDMRQPFEATLNTSWLIHLRATL